MKRCHGESFCKLYNKEKSNCNEYCIGYVQLRNIYKMSNMPKKYQYPIKLFPEKVDVESFVFLRDEWLGKAVERVKNGDGLFLISETKGNGKTTWACKIMNEYFRHVALRNNLRCRGLYINVADFFQRMKESFDNPSDEFEELKENLRSAELVIWDDIGAEAPTRFVVEQLYIYINYRYSEEKAQIFTSNIPLEILKKENSLGDRIVSRIVGQSDVIELKGGNRRYDK